MYYLVKCINNNDDCLIVKNSDFVNKPVDGKLPKTKKYKAKNPNGKIEPVVVIDYSDSEEKLAELRKNSRPRVLPMRFLESESEPKTQITYTRTKTENRRSINGSHYRRVKKSNNKKTPAKEKEKKSDSEDSSSGDTSTEDSSKNCSMRDED
ncbi:hypothetical protein TKK_0004181 [Trichogramma kaykai]